MTSFSSLAKDIFFGSFNLDLLKQFPAPTEDEESIIQEISTSIRKFAESEINSMELDQKAEIPKTLIEGLASLGLFGIGIDEKYCGLGLGATLYAKVFSEIAYHDGSIATMLGAHQSIGLKAIQIAGTEEQKQRWLPDLASGSKIAAFCLTEPNAGSDAYSIQTKAEKISDSEYRINGQKLWITNAGLADIYTVFCKTTMLVDGVSKDKISCFIVEKGMEGLSFGEKEDKFGIRASETRAVFFDNVIVPSSNMIGEEGKGFKLALNILNSGRLFLASGCYGAIKAIFEEAIAHAKERKQFGKSIIEFDMIKEKILLIRENMFTVESMTYFTTGLIDKGLDDYSLESAICKIYASEKIWESADMALQIAGGNGYMREYPFERFLRDARINLIFEGTNEILRCMLTLTGLKAQSDRMKDLLILKDFKSIVERPSVSFKIMFKFLSNRIKKLYLPKHGNDFSSDLREELDILQRLIGEFSIVVENVVIKFGKKIIDNEFIQKRLADACIELYMLFCTFSRVYALLENPNISDSEKNSHKNLFKHIMSRSRQKIRGSLKGVTKNPDKLVSSLVSEL